MKPLYSVAWLMALLTALTLTGCSTFAPFASRLKDSSKVSPSAANIPCYAELTGTDDEGDLDKARRCVSDSIAEFSAIYARAGIFDRAVSYLLWGAGTYAGVEAARTDPSESALKNVAVGVASILGFRAVTGPVEQRQILDRGTEALQCLLTTSYAVHQVADAPLTEFTQDAAVGRITRAIAPLNVDVNRQDQLSSRTLSLMQPAIEAAQNLRAAIRQARKDLALDLVDGLMDVRREVQKQLLSPSPDLEKIAELQQQRIADILRPIIEKQKALDDAKNVSRQQIALMSALARELDSQARSSNNKALADSFMSKGTEYSQVATVATLATLLNDRDGDATQPAVKAFASCVSKVTVSTN